MIKSSSIIKSRDMIIRSSVIALSFLLILASIAGCVVPAQKSDLTPVKVQLKWLHQAQFAGNYVAVEKGLYAQNRIGPVELISFNFTNFPIDSVEKKKVQFGITGADELILAKSRGEAEHVKAVAVIYRINPVCLYSLKSSGIMKPSDLVGKTVGIERAQDGTDINVGILYYAMLGRLGINRSDIDDVTIGYDATELLAGQTDVSSGYLINEPYFVIREGKEVNIIRVADYGVNMYADVLITHEDLILSDPLLVEGFIRATLQGWQYSIENEEEAVDIVMQYAKDRPREHQQYMLHESIPLIHIGDAPLGVMESGEWDGAQNILLQQDLIDKMILQDDLYTTQFLDKIYSTHSIPSAQQT